MSRSGREDPTRRVDPRVFLFITPLLWGLSFPATKAAVSPMGPVSPAAFMFWSRFLGAIAVMATMPFVAKGDFTRQNIRRALAPSLVLGALITGGYSLQTWGIQRTTATNGGLITGLYVVLTPLLLWVLFKQRPKRAVWVTVALSLVGLVLLSMPTVGIAAPGLGDLLVLGATTVWALHVIFIGRFADRYPGTVLAAGQMVATTLFQLVIAVPSGGVQPSAALSVGGLLLITGVLGSGLGYTFQALAQREVTASRASIVLAGESLVAAVAAFVWLDERLKMHQVVGASLIVVAIVGSELWAARPTGTYLDPGAAP